MFKKGDKVTISRGFYDGFTGTIVRNEGPGDYIEVRCGHDQFMKNISDLTIINN